MRRATQLKILGILSTVAFMLALVVSGFVVCAGIPQVTHAIAQSTSNSETSPFSQEDLVQAADAIRDYSFGSHQYDALMATVVDINTQANTPYAHETIEAIVHAPEEYTLTPDAVSHLDDVYNVVQTVFPSLIGCAFIAGICVIGGIFIWGLKTLSHALCWAGGIVIVLLGVLGLWAVIDFNSLFGVFHSLFFTQGTWVFSYDSLLICALPQTFWIAMAAVWVCTSVLLSIVIIVCGVMLMRHENRIAAGQRK